MESNDTRETLRAQEGFNNGARLVSMYSACVLVTISGIAFKTGENISGTLSGVASLVAATVAKLANDDRKRIQKILKKT